MGKASFNMWFSDNCTSVDVGYILNMYKLIPRFGPGSKIERKELERFTL